jgi:hypothetical protein
MIRLGYELGVGVAVDIPLRHTAVTGQTQESGKTTTLEALISRSGLRAVAFVTKRGEGSFRLQTPIPVYFREPVIAPETPMWRWVESIFATLGESVGQDDQALIIQCCRHVLVAEDYKQKGEKKTRVVEGRTKVTTLEHVAENVSTMLKHARGRDKKSLTRLDAYFQIVMPQIKRMKASPELNLRPGLNVMDLEDLTSEMQMLVIRSVLEMVYHGMRNVVVVIPEAWKFVPRARNSPVRFATEMFIREGLALKNVLMLDSQDLANVATEVLKSVGVWILGKQGEINEVKRVVEYIPAIPKIQPIEIMQLGKGEFFAVFSGQVKKVYVQPAGMSDEHAKAIAMGEESADSWKQIVKGLDKREEADAEIQRDDRGSEGTGTGSAGGQRRHDVPGPGGILDERDEPLGDREVALDLSDTAEPEEIVWKEKYEALEREFAELRTAIREGLTSGNWLPVYRVLGESPVTSPSLQDVDTVTPQPPFKPTNGRQESVKISSFTDAGYEMLKSLLLNDPQVIAALENARPTLRITTTQTVINWDGSTLKGRLGKLITEGFFKAPRPAADVLKECQRRGWMTNNNRSNHLAPYLADIVELGFLTREDAGYQATPGMKIENIQA